MGRTLLAKGPRRRVLPLLGSVVALGLLCSCTRIQIAYRLFPWYLKHRAAKYLQLEGPAQTALYHDLDGYVAWHRQHMLPAYAALCRKLAAGMRGQENLAPNIAAVLVQARELYDESLEPLVSPCAQALVSLKPDGIEHLASVYRSDDAERRAKTLEDPEATRKRRAERSIHEVEEFSGSLSAAQERDLRQVSSSIQWPDAQMEQEREAGEAAIIGDLKQAAPQAKIEGDLRSWWLEERDSPQTAIEDAAVDEKLAAYFKSVYGILTPEQREATAKRFDSYAATFDAMAAAASSGTTGADQAQNP